MKCPPLPRMTAQRTRASPAARSTHACSAAASASSSALRACARCSVMNATRPSTSSVTVLDLPFAYVTP